MMGSLKRSRKTREDDGDLEDLYDSENENRRMEDEDDEGEDEEAVEEGEEEVDGDEDEDLEANEVSYDYEAESDSEEEGNMQNDSGKDAEIEELEKDYMHLRNQEQDILKNLIRNKDEDLAKGPAVKNQKALWDRTLEFRFLLQKPFSSSNRLPQEPVRSSVCDSDGAVSAAYDDLITSSKKTLDSLLKLQEALLEKNPSVCQSSDGNSLVSKKPAKDSKITDVECGDEWSQISQMHQRVAAFRNKSIDYWHTKTRLITGAATGLKAFNQNVSDQVASYMRDPSRMTKQMQLSRSAVGVFGTVPEQLENAKGEKPTHDVDPELLDDSEFYQQLLKEFFETVDTTSSEMAFYALKKLRSKKRKIVDRRASKSRKIRYNVHEKIVNFMAPRPMNIPPMAPKLFENLFGLKTQQPVTGV